MNKSIYIVYGIRGAPAVAIFADKQVALDWVAANPGRTLRIEESQQNGVLAIKGDIDTYVDPAVRDLATVVTLDGQIDFDDAIGRISGGAFRRTHKPDPDAEPVPDFAPYPETDVDLVESQTGASRADAARALVQARGDIVNAIMSLET